eukprot:9617649-Alexandrium_andersonii.AAC.1
MHRRARLVVLGRAAALPRCGSRGALMLATAAHRLHAVVVLTLHMRKVVQRVPCRTWCTPAPAP